MQNLYPTLELKIYIYKLNKSKKSLCLLVISFFLFTFVNDKKNCYFRGFSPLRIEYFSGTVQMDGNLKT